jgi:transposase
MQIVEQRIGEPLDTALYDRYVGRCMTLDAIADEFGVTTGTISRWMSAFGIRPRIIKGDRVEAVA